MDKIRKTIQLFKDSWRGLSKKQKYQLVAVFALVLALPTILGGIYTVKLLGSRAYTVTPPVTPKPTPTSIPTCNQKCNLTINPQIKCASGLICYTTTGLKGSSGLCRNPNCVVNTDCTCKSPTPTPRPTVRPTPTPIQLSCNSACYQQDVAMKCGNGLLCLNTSSDPNTLILKCRNPLCPQLSGCICSTPTGKPTPTPIASIKPIPTDRPTPRPTIRPIPTPTSRPICRFGIFGFCLIW